MAVYQKKVNLQPLHDFLSNNIAPEELSDTLDSLEFEFSNHLLKNPNRIDDDTMNSLHYVHELKKVVTSCVTYEKITETD